MWLLGVLMLLRVIINGPLDDSPTWWTMFSSVTAVLFMEFVFIADSTIQSEHLSLVWLSRFTLGCLLGIRLFILVFVLFCYIIFFKYFMQWHCTLFLWFLMILSMCTAFNFSLFFQSPGFLYLVDCIECRDSKYADDNGVSYVHILVLLILGIVIFNCSRRHLQFVISLFNPMY